MHRFSPKDPDAVKDYTIDWSDWLDADTIATSTITFPTGLTKPSDSNDTTSQTFWASAGTTGTEYAVECKITTAAGRTEIVTVVIPVKDQ